MTYRSTKLKFIIVVALLFCVVTAIWLPFSFNISPMWDVWAAYRLVQTGDAPLIRVNIETLRPFAYIAWYMAYAIDSTSFVGITTLFITLLVAKGSAFYLIVRRLFPQLTSSFAFAAAAIATVHPADPQALYAGAIGGHLGIFLFLLSVYLLLVFVDNGRWPTLAAALVSSLLSMGFSERTYPLVMLTPLLVVYRTGQLNRRALTAIGWWLASALPVFVLYGFSFLSESYRRTNRLENSSFNPITMIERTIRALQQVFVDGWILSSTNIAASWLLIALAAGFIVAVVLVVFQRDEVAPSPDITRTHRRILWLAIAGGVVVAAAGFAVFAPLERYSTELRRTLYLSVFGGALTLTGILYLITSYLPAKRYLFPVSVGMILGFGVLNLLFMQQHEYDAAIKQHTTLAAIAEVVPAPSPDSALLITFDDAEQFKAAQFPAPTGLQNALSVLYGYNLGVCRVVTKFPDTCQLTSDGLDIIRPGANDVDEEMDEMEEGQSYVYSSYPYENVIAIHFGGRGATRVMNADQFMVFAPDDEVAAQIAQHYQPQVYRGTEDILPARYHTMLLPKATAPRGDVPFVLVEGDGLKVAAYLRYPQQNELETDGTYSWLWLGDGVPQGVTLYLQAETSLTAQLTLAVKPGPSRQDQTRTLEIRNLQTDVASVITFNEQTTVTSEAIALDDGLNPIQITVVETPDTPAPHGDPRSLLVLLDSVLVTTNR